MDTLPGFHNTKAGAAVPHILLRHSKDLAKIPVRKSVLFRLYKGIIGGKASTEFLQGGLLLSQLLHLLQEITLDFRKLIYLLDTYALFQSSIYNEVTIAGRKFQKLKQLFFALFDVCLHVSKPVVAVFQTADRLLERFLKVFADAHHFTDSAHLCSELVLHAFEFFKSPAGKFDYNVVAVRNIFIQCPVLSARNIGKGHPRCKHRRNKGNRKTGSLTGQRRGAGGSRIDFDNDISVRPRIMRPLDIGSADHLDGLNNLVGFFLKTFLYLLRNGKHRG